MNKLIIIILIGICPMNCYAKTDLEVSRKYWNETIEFKNYSQTAKLNVLLSIANTLIYMAEQKDIELKDKGLK